MDNETKKEAALDCLLDKLSKYQVSQDLQNRVILSFAPFSKEASFSISGLLEMLFGRRQNVRSFAMASAIFLALVGGVTGYVGAELVSYDDAVIELLSQAFFQDVYIGETEMEI